MKNKVVSLVFLWISIGFSIVFLISVVWVKLIVFFIAMGVTLHIVSLKTLQKQKN
jgi:hypothetical protein